MIAFWGKHHTEVMKVRGGREGYKRFLRKRAEMEMARSEQFSDFLCDLMLTFVTFVWERSVSGLGRRSPTVKETESVPARPES